MSRCIGVVAPAVEEGGERASSRPGSDGRSSPPHGGSRRGARHGDGKDAADGELKKFYSAVLPPDISAARRITYLKMDADGAAAPSVTRTGVERRSRATIATARLASSR